MSSTLRAVIAAFAASILLAGCVTQSRFAPIGDARQPKPGTCPIDVFTGQPPQRDFVRVARLDAHVENTFFVPQALSALLPSLKRQACLAGADAIIDIKESRSMLIETQIYHVTATAIAYR